MKVQRKDGGLEGAFEVQDALADALSLMWSEGSIEALRDRMGNLTIMVLALCKSALADQQQLALLNALTCNEWEEVDEPDDPSSFRERLRRALASARCDLAR